MTALQAKHFGPRSTVQAILSVSVNLPEKLQIPRGKRAIKFGTTVIHHSSPRQATPRSPSPTWPMGQLFRPLRLSWWRRPLRLRSAEPARCGILLEGNAHPAGSDEAGMDHSQASGGTGRRSASLGPGLPVPSEMGTSGKARDLVHSDPTGGTG